ncbi:hypothetical protein [Streptomyces sp. NPDC057412]|uniref:hypothetical protein n=1 Tax=Streptomyces sp. NPDC057412 TaxID=3346123 RepID=UPI0036810F48
MSRPQYQPVYGRWERAESPVLFGGVGHAYDTAYAYTASGATLCGIVHPSISPSPYLWVPDWDDACGACKKTASVTDDRWPPHMRAGNRLNPTPPPGSCRPPF